MTLDSVAPNVDTVLTPELRRLFLAAGCDPACHACQRKINVGEILRLVPHGNPLTDEMCCHRCGSRQLTLRDRRENSAGPRAGGGYSRPSMAVVPPQEQGAGS